MNQIFIKNRRGWRILYVEKSTQQLLFYSALLYVSSDMVVSLDLGIFSPPCLGFQSSKEYLLRKAMIHIHRFLGFPANYFKVLRVAIQNCNYFPNKKLHTFNGLFYNWAPQHNIHPIKKFLLDTAVFYFVKYRMYRERIFKWFAVLLNCHSKHELLGQPS